MTQLLALIDDGQLLLFANIIAIFSCFHLQSFRFTFAMQADYFG